MPQKISEVEVQVAGRRLPLRRVQLICDDPSLTKQSFTETTNIRNILQKYAKTGILGDPTRTPIYGDFSEIDYQNSLNLVANVRSEFERQPVKIRERFKNDPAEMLAFLADEKNHGEAVELGLREAPPAKVWDTTGKKWVDPPAAPAAPPGTPPA